MSAQAFAQVNDIGVELIVTCQDQEGNVIDIGAASVLFIKLQYPDGTSKDCTAELYTNGADGNMVYTTQANDLSQAGLYLVQGKIGFSSGPVMESGRKSELTVFSNVDNA